MSPTDAGPSEPGRDRSRLVIVVSAPSGAGKTSLCERAAQLVPNLVHSVSYTTRPPRPDEENSRDYHFVDQATFQRMVDAGEFAEWAWVHGNLYGTPERLLEKHLREGKAVILDIDTQGARQLRARYPQGVSVFIVPPNLAMLEARLRQRRTDAEEEIQRRLKKAQEELKHSHEYQYVVINDVLERAAHELAAIIAAERCRSFRVDLSFLNHEAD